MHSACAALQHAMQGMLRGACGAVGIAEQNVEVGASGSTTAAVLRHLKTQAQCCGTWRHKRSAAALEALRELVASARQASDARTWRGRPRGRQATRATRGMGHLGGGLHLVTWSRQRRTW
jgi:hypothetical protein